MPRRTDRQVFVTVDWLAEHLHDANLRIIDGRFVSAPAPALAGEELYAAGHIPGAIFVHWRKDLSLDTPPVPNRLLPPEAFAARMGQFGVDANTTVIIYDLGDVIWAARIWWALKYYGHDKVYVLQGGAAAWQEAGEPWTTDVLQPPAKTFVAQPRPAMRASKDQVLRAIQEPTTTIIETRRVETLGDDEATVQGAFALPSTAVFADKGAYRDLISEAELDRYLQDIGADRSACLVAT